MAPPEFDDWVWRDLKEERIHQIFFVDLAVKEGIVASNHELLQNQHRTTIGPFGGQSCVLLCVHAE